MTSSPLFPAIAALLFPALAGAQSLNSDYCGIQIVTQGYAKENDVIRGLGKVDAGVKISFLIQSPEGGIIALDNHKATISAFTDDKGDRLMDKERLDEGFEMCTVSKDGRAAVFTLHGTVVPPATLQKVTAKGTMGVSVATKKEVVKGGAIKEGTEVVCGTQKLEVTEVSTEKGETSVSLQSDDNFSRFLEMHWLDASGKRLEAENTGGGCRGTYAEIAGVRVATNWTYWCSVKVKGTPATVEFLAWTDMKTVHVPFSATVAAGVVK